MYIRVTRTVQDRGVLVRPEDLIKTVTDREVDWYYSTFTYGEDAKEYWEDHGDSLNGYKGSASTTTLYWDLDCKADPKKAVDAAINLYNKLVALGLKDGVELYFSGNKGFHVLLRTKQTFTPQETAAICFNVVKEAGVPLEVFDTTVYNINRIFRVVNTKHKESGLYKIPISIEELQDKEEAIRELAKKPRDEEFDSKEVDATELKKYAEKVQEKVANVVDLKVVGKDGVPANETQGPDLSLCPPGHRRCIYTLEQGYYGPSERHTAILRLSAYYRGQGFSRKHAGNLIFESLNKRIHIYSDLSEINETECNRDIDQVYSKEWKGGMYTCKTDQYLASKCDHGEGPCFNDAKVVIRNVLNIDQLFNNYIRYGEEALIEYPKFGISWIDDRVRLRPKNTSIIAGANGSGKTSLAIELIDSLNKQKIFHAFFSLDMSDSAILEKLGAKYTPYSQKQIEKAFNVNSYNSTIVEEVKTAFQERLPYTLFDFTSSATMVYIEQTVMGLKQVYDNLQLVIVDYAGRIIGEFENQYANATHNAMMGNDVAKRTNTHLLFISQVSRENGDHTTPLRSSRVSKDSGAWEENATAVLTVWRPFGNGITGEDDYVHVYIGKNRSGELGENVFYWEGKTGTFTELQSEAEFETYCRLCEQNEMDRPNFKWRISEKVNETTGEIKETNEREKVQDRPLGRFKRPRNNS